MSEPTSSVFDVTKAAIEQQGHSRVAKEHVRRSVPQRDHGAGKLIDFDAWASKNCDGEFLHAKLQEALEYDLPQDRANPKSAILTESLPLEELRLTKMF